MTITLYGIKNCDSVKKAKKWFDESSIDYIFHDFRVDGIDPSWLAETEKQVGWEVLLNKRGTTFRQLDENTKASLDKDKAIALMLEQPTLIKRPVVCSDKQPLVGFKQPDYIEAFNQ